MATKGLYITDLKRQCCNKLKKVANNPKVSCYIKRKEIQRCSQKWTSKGWSSQLSCVLPQSERARGEKLSYPVRPVHCKAPFIPTTTITLCSRPGTFISSRESMGSLSMYTMDRQRQANHRCNFGHQVTNALCRPAPTLLCGHKSSRIQTISKWTRKKKQWVVLCKKGKG